MQHSTTSKHTLKIYLEKLPYSINNAYYTDKKTNTRHLSVKGREFRKMLHEKLRFEMRVTPDHFPDNAEFSITLHLYLTPKMATKIDLTNYIKLPEDCLFGSTKHKYFHNLDDNAGIIKRIHIESLPADKNYAVLVINQINHPATRGEIG